MEIAPKNIIEILTHKIKHNTYANGFEIRNENNENTELTMKRARTKKTRSIAERLSVYYSQFNRQFSIEYLALQAVKF